MLNNGATDMPDVAGVASRDVQGISPAIELADVAKHFDTKIVFKNVTIAVPKGTVSLIVGNNGVGKTTLLNVMAGILSPDAGTVTCAVPPQKRLYLGTKPALYARLTALENVKFWEQLYGGNPDDAQILSALEQVGLRTYAHIAAGVFSTGMLRRLHIVRAVLRCPELLFLDEPENGLDATGIDILRNIVAKQKHRGATVLWITHAPKAMTDRADFVITVDRQTVTMTENRENTKNPE